MSGDELTGGPPVGEPLSLDRLLATYTAWSSADVVDTARRHARDAGDIERRAALEAMSSAGPSPVEALAAAHELTSLLAGWRWHTVRAAREAGATWDDIGAATGTDPATARTEFLDRVERAGEQATAAGFEFRDEQRYRDAAAPDQDHINDTDRADHTDPEATAVNHVDAPAQHEDEQVPVWSRWPVPDPSRSLEAITDRELITRAELDEAVAMTGIGGDTGSAWADLDATRAEAERRAVDQPPESVPAQVAGYISLVSEDHTGALALEADTWRADLDHALPLDHTSSDDAAESVRQVAASVDARMSAEPPPADGAGFDGAGFDLERLDEVTEQWGYAVFDPDAPGGVRAPSSSEYAELLTELAPPSRDDVADAVAGEVERGWSDAPAAQVDEVARRAADPTFVYNPAAEWGDDDYREPRSDAEAAARVEHLDALRALDPPGPPAGTREPTEVEDALYDAAEHASLADRAHDPDHEAWARYDRLLALQDLIPVPTDDHPRDPDVAESEAVELADGPVTDIHGRQWPNREASAGGPADPVKGATPSPYPDNLGRFQQRVDDARAQLAARGSAPAGDEGEARREQLTRWHDDDRAEHRAQDGDGASDDPLLMRCFGDPDPKDASESGERW